jgi:hypothetical protein
VAAEPDAGLVTPARRAVEPLVHAPEAVQPAGVRRVGVVHDAILEHERAHAGRFSSVRRPVRPHARSDLREPATLLVGLYRRPQVQHFGLTSATLHNLTEIVLDDSRLFLLLGVRRLEVVINWPSEELTRSSRFREKKEPYPGRWTQEAG